MAGGVGHRSEELVRAPLELRRLPRDRVDAVSGLVDADALAIVGERDLLDFLGRVGDHNEPIVLEGAHVRGRLDPGDRGAVHDGQLAG